MRKLLIALAAGLLLSLGVVRPAGATPPLSGSYVSPWYTTNFVPQPPHLAGGNMIITATWDTTFSGVFTGTANVEATINFHADGHGTINASFVCDPCTVVDPTAPGESRSGRLVGSLQGTNTWVPAPGGGLAVLEYHGNVRGNGSRGLAGLHFDGTVNQPSQFADATTTVQYHFDP